MTPHCPHRSARRLTGCAGTDLETGEPIYRCDDCGRDFPVHDLTPLEEKDPK